MHPPNVLRTTHTHTLTLLPVLPKSLTLTLLLLQPKSLTLTLDPKLPPVRSHGVLGSIVVVTNVTVIEIAYLQGLGAGLRVKG